LPLAFTAAVAAPLRISLAPVLLLAGIQLLLLPLVSGVMIAHVGAPASSFAPHAGTAVLAGGATTVSLLFLCASLPLYLGAEVRGGARVVRSHLGAAVCVVGALALVAAFPLALVPDRLRFAPLPGYAIAEAYAGRWLAVPVGATIVASILTLVFAEFVALGRLLRTMSGIRSGAATLAVGGAFLVADAAALLGPDGFYEQALRPSLFALYLSQLIVFVVYPLRSRASSTRRLAPLALASLATAPMVYGIYLVLTDRIAS
jgi:hypothetical protein